MYRRDFKQTVLWQKVKKETNEIAWALYKCDSQTDCDLYCKRAGEVASDMFEFFREIQKQHAFLESAIITAQFRREFMKGKE